MTNQPSSSELLDQLARHFQVKQTNRGQIHEIKIDCPAHGGDDANLAIWDDGNGVSLGAKCHSADCAYEEIRQAIIAVCEIDINPKLKNKSGVSWDTYRVATFKHPNGNTISEYVKPCEGLTCTFMINTRKKELCYGSAIDSKKGTGKHVWTDKGKRTGYLVLLFESMVDPYGTVHLCEGVKTARAVQGVGSIGATWLGGANNVANCDFSSLEGMDVIIHPDNDTQGMKAAVIAKDKAEKAGAALVKIAAPVDLFNGADLADLEDMLRIEKIIDSINNPGIEVNMDVDYKDKSVNPAALGPEFIGIFYAKQFIDKYRYDTYRGWYEWNGKKWFPAPKGFVTNQLYDFISYKRQQCAIDILSQHTEQEVINLVSNWILHEKNHLKANFQKGWTAGFQTTLTRNFKEYPAWIIPTNNNMLVNVKTGQVEEYDHESDVLSHTHGGYFPDKLTESTELLQKRFDGVLSNDGLVTLFKALGVAMSGLAQEKKSVLTWLTGTSGGGKGSTNALMIAALGKDDKAITVKNDFWKTANFRSDIDALMCDIIEKKPIIIFCDETPERASHGFINAVAGGGMPYTARRAFMPGMITGTLTCSVWFSLVKLPSMQVGDGIERRSVAIEFANELKNSLPKERLAEGNQFTQELLDAVITAGCDAAMRVHNDFEFANTWPTDEFTNETMMKIDPVLDFLRNACPYEWDQRLWSETCDEIRDFSENPNISNNLITRRLKEVKHWDKERTKLADDDKPKWHFIYQDAYKDHKCDKCS